MGSLYQLECKIVMKAKVWKKRMVDEPGCLNGSLKISLGTLQIQTRSPVIALAFNASGGLRVPSWKVTYPRDNPARVNSIRTLLLFVLNCGTIQTL